MSITVKVVTALIVLTVALTGGAIVKNQVPLGDPPGLIKRLIVYLTRNSARTVSGHVLPELRPRTYPLPPDRTLDLTARAAEAAGWRITGKDAARHELDAVVSTPWLRFKDDVHVSLIEAPDGGTVVEVTSRSRVGRADFGANIAHVMELYDRLDALVRQPR